MSIEFMGDPYAAQLRAAKAEGELAAVRDALRDFAEDNGLNPEMEPRDLLAKAAGGYTRSWTQKLSMQVVEAIVSEMAADGYDEIAEEVAAKLTRSQKFREKVAAALADRCEA